MTDYRRAFIPGGRYFFTVVIRDRRPLVANADKVTRVRAAFRRAMTAQPFGINAVVVIPGR